MISMNRFHYNKGTKVFSADVSELGTSIFDQIYDTKDGLTLYSEDETVNGETLGGTYYLNYVSEDSENETLYWELKPSPTTVRECPQLMDTTVIIFND